MPLQSELPLPGLPAGGGSGEVSIRLDDAYSEHQNACPYSGWQRADRQQAVLFLKHTGCFRVLAGSEIWVSPAPQARESLLRLYLLGTVMALLAYQRGKLALHGSVVQVNGGAIAVLAGSGAGKSSLAAALQTRGHTLLADDLAAVEFSDRGAAVHPGFPQLKLGRDVAAALGIPGAALQPLDADEPKLAWRPVAGLPRGPVPLKKVYLLAAGERQASEPVGPQEAILELVRHSYPTRLAYPADGRHLLQCGRLARAVPILRLIRTPHLADLADLAAWVETDLERDSPPRL